MNERRVTLGDGLDMHVRSAGAGEYALVCVHGLAQSGFLWEGVIADLPEGWCGHAVDLMGFGDSPEAPDGHSIAFHADCVRRFIASLPQDNVVLAANSLGGVVAMTVAAEHGDLLMGLVLTATGARVRDPDGLRASLEHWRTLELDDEARRAIARRYVFREPDPATLERIAADVGKARRRAILETMRSSLETDLTERLADIEPPTLVVQGMEDKGRPPADGLTIAEGVRDGRLLALPRVGHTPMLEAPREFGRWLHSSLNHWANARGGAA